MARNSGSGRRILSKLTKKSLGFEDNFAMGHACKDGCVDKGLAQDAVDPLMVEPTSSSDAADQVKITKWHRDKCIKAEVFKAVLGIV